MPRLPRGRVIAVACFAVVACGLGYGAAAILGGRGEVPSSPSPSASVNPSPGTSPSGSLSPSPTPSPSVSPTFDTSAYSIDAPDSPWVVTNKTRPLNPLDYVPDDLTTMPHIAAGSGQHLRAEAAAALESMEQAASAAGAGFSISTAYRSYNQQAGIYSLDVRERGRAAADRSRARPGYSEHQTGFSVDIFDDEACRLQYCFGKRPAGIWVAEHAWEYGFIMRYPKEKGDVTGFIWEPWHLRYVGIDLATEMHEKGILTLEEFFGLPAAPTYL